MQVGRVGVAQQYLPVCVCVCVCLCVCAANIVCTHTYARNEHVVCVRRKGVCERRVEW